MKSFKYILSKIILLIIILLVMFVIGWQEGRVFNYSFSGNAENIADKPKSISLEEVKYLFPKAASFSEDALKQVVVSDASGKIIGYIISSKPYSDSLVGFAGPVHFIMGIDTKNNLVGIKLTEHNESPGYIDFITKEGFFSKLKDMPLSKIINEPIDAVSGASMTTNVIIKALKQKTAEYNKTIIKTRNQNLKKKIINGLSLVVIVFSLLCFFTKTFKKYRILLLVSSVLILGFLNGTLLSMFLLHGWILNGIPLFTQSILALIFILAVLIPLFVNKSFYCDYLCPFGAAQELAGKIIQKKIAVPYRDTLIIKHLRTIIFNIIIILLVIGISFDLTNFEPFSAFVFVSASAVAITLALVFIILSVFFNKPWCYYFCPTGRFLALFRIKKQN